MSKDTEKGLLEKLTQAVIDGNLEEAEKLTGEAIEEGFDPVEVIDSGLAKGIRIVGDKFGTMELFLPDLMMAAEAMNSGLRIVKPVILRKGISRKSLGKVVLGTVAGDIHDLGKSIVGAFLTVTGFEVLDAGVDVPVKKFIELVKEMKPDILGLSALLTSTLPQQREVIEALKKAGLRDKVRVMIGGAPVTQSWADEIGADAYAADVKEAVEIAGKLVKEANVKC